LNSSFFISLFSFLLSPFSFLFSPFSFLLSLFSFLTFSGANVITSVDRFGGTPITDASKNNNLDIVTILNNSLLQKKKKSNKNSSSTSITNQQLNQQSNHIYNALNAIDGNDGFTVDLIYEILENCGILSNDPRIQSFLPSLPVVRSSFPLFCLFFFVLLLLKIIPLFFFFIYFQGTKQNKCIAFYRHITIIIKSVTR
jgi:hypothetical protein